MTSPQLVLLSDRIEPLPPYQKGSRTSKRAAERLAKSGHHWTVRNIILALLTAHPEGLTQKEMAWASVQQRASIASACNWLAGGKWKDGRPERAPLVRPSIDEREGCAVYRLAREGV